MISSEYYLICKSYSAFLFVDGEVRRCARTNECNARVPPQVERVCCNTDLCN